MPRTYREKYWVSLGGVVLLSLFLLAQTYMVDGRLVYLVAILFLFMLVNLAATRIVLYPDRIESVNLLSRRALPKDQIDRLEVRETRVKGKVVKNYWLIARNDPDRPMLISSKIRMDDSWFEWMAPIPETVVPPPDKQSTGLAVMGMLLCVAGLIVPVIMPRTKPYFDILFLLLPWLACLFLATNARQPASLASGMASIISMMAAVYLLAVGPGVNGYVVDADSWVRIFACVGMALVGLVLLRFSPIDSLNMRSDAIVMVVLATGIYGFGAAMTANQLFDMSVAQTASVPIQNRFMATGKHAGPRFNLAPWGPETRSRIYTPSQATYARADSVCASLHPGALGMRWYQVSDLCP